MKAIFAVAGLSILVAGLLAMILRYFGITPSKALMAPSEPAIVATGGNQVINSTTPDSFDSVYWAQINEWHFKDQADDRRPMNSSVGKGHGSASARRSAARLSHQGMDKEWSRERHD